VLISPRLIAMADYEKLPLVQPTSSHPHVPISQRRKFVWRAIPFIALALIWFCAESKVYRKHEASPSRPLEAQCPQVEPLLPSKTTAALAKMEEFLDTETFRNESAARLAGVVQIPSQSYDDLGPIGEDKRWDTMYDVAAYLEKTFPLVYSTLQLEKVNTHGLLYTWQGTDGTLKPTVLMAHQDVVPVAEATINQWTYPPFSGTYDGHYVWGRGASDCKNSLIGILETVELLIKAGFAPKRTLILSFGFDEEISGLEGAGHLGSTLLERYGKDGVAIIVDEGNGIESQWGTTFATPAVGEKGYIDVEVIIRMPGGHSSVPPEHNGIGVMSELITTIEANLYKPHFHSENPFLGLLECGAAHGRDFPSEWKELISSGNKEKLASEVAASDIFLKYLLTTSVAVDIIGGGVKANALPERTTALINHRINVGDSTATVKEHITKLATTVAEKYNLTLHAFNGEGETPSSITLDGGNVPLEPAPVSPTDVESATPYSVLSGTTRAVFGTEIIMAPGLSTGNTDTRYYWGLTTHIFRYLPGWDPEQIGFGGIHTVDEHVSMLSHIGNVKWFGLFIRNMDEVDLP
jgi:Gly-Xaa carboxypeptidase